MIVTDRYPVDAWTLVHIAAGAAMGLIGVPFWIAVCLAVLYELLENMRAPKKTIPGMSPDAHICPWNAAVDVVAVAIGAGVVLYWKRK